MECFSDEHGVPVEDVGSSMLEPSEYMACMTVAAKISLRGAYD